MTQKHTKPKILIIGDAVASTGFARVIRSIFTPLANDFELHQLATRYDGGPHDYPWKLYQAGKEKSVYGYDQILPLLEQIRPAIVFLLYDISFQVRYLEILRRATAPAKIVVYSPVEAGPIAPEIIQQLNGVSRYVLYTDYGRHEIAEALAAVREQNPAFNFPELEVIPHGVDTDRFYPLAENSDVTAGDSSARRMEARKALGFNDAGHRDAFIVLNANRRRRDQSGRRKD